MENKQHILKLLLICLQETRAGEDITGLYLQDARDAEYVRITYQNGFHKFVNVTADSDIAMLRDILKEVD